MALKKVKKPASKKKSCLLVLHGPNLNLLGEREPTVYGTLSLRELNSEIQSFAEAKNCQLKIFQSNSEGKLIDLLHAHRKNVQGVVFNPGAYTHYSYALRDAVAAIGTPVVEVHLSDIHAREDFRKISVIAPVCISQISGMGVESYTRGIEVLLSALAQSQAKTIGAK